MEDLEDRLAMTELMAAWIHRDLGHWEEVRDLLHSDGAIKIPWFEGLASDFVDAIARMRTDSDLTSKHLIGLPLIVFNGERAVVETECAAGQHERDPEARGPGPRASLRPSRTALSVRGRSSIGRASTTWPGARSQPVRLKLTPSSSLDIRSNTAQSLTCSRNRPPGQRNLCDQRQ